MAGMAQSNARLLTNKRPASLEGICPLLFKQERLSPYSLAEFARIGRSTKYVPGGTQPESIIE
jgi:hypothetical protein